MNYCTKKWANTLLVKKGNINQTVFLSLGGQATAHLFFIVIYGAL
jgi:hypothetical protein